MREIARAIYLGCGVFGPGRWHGNTDLDEVIQCEKRDIKFWSYGYCSLNYGCVKLREPSILVVEYLDLGRWRGNTEVDGGDAV